METPCSTILEDAEKAEIIQKYHLIMDKYLSPLGMKTDNVDICLIDPPKVNRARAQTLIRVIHINSDVDPDSEIGINTILHEYFHLFFARKMREIIEQDEVGNTIIATTRAHIGSLNENELEKLAEKARQLYRHNLIVSPDSKDSDITIFRKALDVIKYYYYYLEGLIKFDYRRNPPDKEIPFAKYREQRIKEFCASWFLALQKLEDYLLTASPLEEGLATYISCKIQGLPLKRFKQLDNGICHPTYHEYANRIESIFGDNWQKVLQLIKDAQEAEQGPFALLRNVIE